MSFVISHFSSKCGYLFRIMTGPAMKNEKWKMRNGKSGLLKTERPRNGLRTE
jgi:hypothetical protein